MKAGADGGAFAEPGRNIGQAREVARARVTSASRVWRAAIAATGVVVAVGAFAYAEWPGPESLLRWAGTHIQLVYLLGAATATSAVALAAVLCGLLVQLRQSRRTQAALQESRRSLERAQRVGQIGSWSATIGNPIRLSWSSEVYRIFGVDPATWGATFDDLSGIVHPDDVGRLQRARDEAVATGGSYSMDYRIRRPDGAERWVHTEAECIRPGTAGSPEVFGTVQDITDRKLSEEALRLSEARFSDFAETASDWYWETGPDHRFTYMSDRIRAFGLNAADWIGVRRFDYAADYGDQAEKWREHIAMLERHEAFRDFVYQTQPRTGRQLYISVSGKPLFGADGAFLGYRGTGRDVTAAIAAEEALRLSQTRLRDYAETASDWYWETGPDHRFTYMSSRILAFGQNAQVRIGKQRHELAADRDTESEKWRAHMAQLERHEPFRNFVYTMKLPDEKEAIISVSGKPFFSSTGQFLGYRGTARDVTADIQAEAKLREAKAAAEAASAAKTTFLANMSHELRTPLNAIIGFAEALSGGHFGRMNQKQLEYLGDITESGNHLLLLISDLLDVAKIEAGKFELHREPVNIVDEIAACVRLVQAKADAGRVSLAVDIPAQLPPHPVDRRALRQVLLNLLSNAVKFTQAGGRVVVEARAAAAGELTISVSDTGVGIAPQDLSKIVVPFGALARNASLSRAQEGTGLGLPLSKSLIELHGGHLEIRSEVGRGTTAIARFPAIGAAA
ncbi:MAG TPA: ATP-binding protein [Alphaproteobacteria bacterium]|nr:ATP-binding protein [Alphaproteobacteria bacterium]